MFGLVLVKQCGNQTLPCTLVVNGTRSQCSHWDDLSLLCAPPGEEEGGGRGGGEEGAVCTQVRRNVS